MASNSTGQAAAPQSDDRGEMLYFDDLEPGMTFLTACHELDRDQIVAFASVYDPQPFHLDDEAAKATLFGGLAASGWQTAALSMRLMVTTGPRIAGGMIGLEAKASWPQPTRPGDVLQVAMEIISVTPSRSRPDRGTAVMRSVTRNQRGDALQILDATMVVPRRPQI